MREALVEAMQEAELYEIYEALRHVLPSKLSQYNLVDHHNQLTDNARGFSILLAVGETHFHES